MEFASRRFDEVVTCNAIEVGDDPRAAAFAPPTLETPLVLLSWQKSIDARVPSVLSETLMLLVTIPSAAAKSEANSSILCGPSLNFDVGAPRDRRGGGGVAIMSHSSGGARSVSSSGQDTSGVPCPSQHCDIRPSGDGDAGGGGMAVKSHSKGSNCIEVCGGLDR